MRLLFRRLAVRRVTCHSSAESKMASLCCEYASFMATDKQLNKGFRLR